MYIQLGTTWLTNPNDGTSERLVTSTQELAIDGEIVAQEEPLIRAVSEALFARGNLNHTITFKVTRRFPTLGAAFAFGASYRSSLPNQGALMMVCGLASETQQICRSANAVLKNVKWEQATGLTVTHSYTVRCQAITYVPTAAANIGIATQAGQGIEAESGAVIQADS